MVFTMVHLDQQQQSISRNLVPIMLLSHLARCKKPLVILMLSRLTKIASFILHIESCVSSNQTAGPGCRIPYEIQTATSYTKVAIAGQYDYWRVVVTEKTPMWVSVRATDGKHNPLLIATQGQLPRYASTNGDTENIDLYLCTEAHCEGANIMRHNAGACSHSSPF